MCHGKGNTWLKSNPDNQISNRYGMLPGRPVASMTTKSTEKFSALCLSHDGAALVCVNDRSHWCCLTLQGSSKMAMRKHCL